MKHSPIKVLFLTRYPSEGASSRYRVFQYLPYLEELGVSCVTQSFMDSQLYKASFAAGKTPLKIWLTCKALFRRLVAVSKFPDFDIIYLQRELFPLLPPFYEQHMKSRGAVLIFDYDDALFIAKPSRYNPIASHFRSANKTLKLFTIANCVIAGNDWLRDRARNAGAHAVTVEVAEDTDRIPMHEPHTNDGTVTIGWLGSTSTVKYLQLIAPALQRIAREYTDRVRFEIMGGGDFQMPGVPWRHTDWSLEAELQALARFDIGLMPLPSEDWAKGKSGGKARTYMAAGVVPVCTGIGYNLTLIQQAESGYLCNTEHDWHQALKALIEDASLRQRIAIQARREVESRFSLPRQAAKLRQTFDEVLAGTQAAEPQQHN